MEENLCPARTQLTVTPMSGAFNVERERIKSSLLSSMDPSKLFANEISVGKPLYSPLFLSTTSFIYKSSADYPPSILKTKLKEIDRIRANTVV